MTRLTVAVTQGGAGKAVLPVVMDDARVMTGVSVPMGLPAGKYQFTLRADDACGSATTTLRALTVR